MNPADAARPVGPGRPPRCWPPVRSPPAADAAAADRLRARQWRHRRAVDDRRSGASRSTAGRASGCMPSTCPTRWRATRTTSRRPAAARTAEQCAVPGGRGRQGAGAHRRAEGGAGRQFARRQRDPQLRRRTSGGAAKVSHASSAARPTMASGPTAGLPRRTASSTAPARSWPALNAPKGPNGDEVTPGVQLDDDPLRQQRQVRPARRRVDRRARASRRTSRFDGPGAEGRENVVLPGRDHREVSFHPEAFAQTYDSSPAARRPRWPSRREPSRCSTARSAAIGPGSGPTTCRWPARRSRCTRSMPATGARRGAALHRKHDRRRRPLGPAGRRRADARYEFVHRRARAMRPRTSTARRSRARRSIVNLRAERLADADKDARGGGHADPAARLLRRAARPHRARRPTPAPGIPPGVAGVSQPASSS